MVPVVINMFFLKINAMQNTSSLNIGQNYIDDLNSFYKSNTGTGSTYGDQTNVDQGDVLLDDSDLVDMPSIKETLPNKASKLLKWNNIIK